MKCFQAAASSACFLFLFCSRFSASSSCLTAATQAAASLKRALALARSRSRPRARSSRSLYALFSGWLFSTRNNLLSTCSGHEEERARAFVYGVKEGGFGSSKRHPTFLLMLIVSHMLINACCTKCDILMSELISRREVEPILSRTHRRRQSNR